MRREQMTPQCERAGREIEPHRTRPYHTREALVKAAPEAFGRHFITARRPLIAPSRVGAYTSTGVER
jgi:hypothetical protein